MQQRARRERRYTHRWKYDPRYGRPLAKAWPNGVGRGFVYSSIGAVEIETGLGTGVPSVLRQVDTVNALGAVRVECSGWRIKDRLSPAGAASHAADCFASALRGERFDKEADL